MIKRGFFAFIIIFLLVVNLFPVYAVEMSQQDKAYYDKLIQSGLNSVQAAKIMEKFPDENNLLAAVRTAVDNNESEIEGVPLALLKIDFYKPGVVTTWLKKWWQDNSFFDSINSFFKGLFGNTIDGIFKWMIGIKKDGDSRLRDLIVGYLTAFLIGFIFWIRMIPIKRMWASGALAGSGMPYKFALIHAERVKWLRTIVGAWWKIWILFPWIYFGLFQLPFINRILEIVTFYHLMPGGSGDFIADWLPNIIIRTLFSAMILGFLPDIAERAVKMREAQKEQKKLMQIKATAQILKDLAATPKLRTWKP